MGRWWRALAGAALLLCSAPSPVAAQAADAEKVAAELPWDYQDGGAGWPTSFPECGSDLQSPIDLDVASAAAGPPSFLRLAGSRQHALAAHILKADRTALTLDVSGSRISLVSEDFAPHYSMASVHWHVPAEHTLNGVRYPAERHVILEPLDAAARSERGDTHIPILSFIEVYNASIPGGSDPLLSKLQQAGLTNDFSSDSTREMKIPAPVDWLEGRFFVYPGAGSRPPCQEVAVWAMNVAPRPISPLQLQILTSITSKLEKAHVGGFPPPQVDPSATGGVAYFSASESKGVARALQPRNGRTVLLRTFYQHQSL